MCVNPEDYRCSGKTVLKYLELGKEEEVDVFLKLSCFFDDPADVGNLISGSSAFQIQLEYLEVHGSHIVVAWLREF